MSGKTKDYFNRTGRERIKGGKIYSQQSLITKNNPPRDNLLYQDLERVDFGGLGTLLLFSLFGGLNKFSPSLLTILLGGRK